MSCEARKVSCVSDSRATSSVGRWTARSASAVCREPKRLLRSIRQPLERLLTSVRDISRTLPGNHTVNVLDVLRWPGVLRDETDNGDELLKAAHVLFVGTVEELIAARAREGQRLRELLEQRCNGLEALVAHVRTRLPEVHARVRSDSMIGLPS